MRTPATRTLCAALMLVAGCGGTGFGGVLARARALGGCRSEELVAEESGGGGVIVHGCGERMSFTCVNTVVGWPGRLEAVCAPDSREWATSSSGGSRVAVDELTIQTATRVASAPRSPRAKRRTTCCGHRRDRCARRRPAPRRGRAPRRALELRERQHPTRHLRHSKRRDDPRRDVRPAEPAITTATAIPTARRRRPRRSATLPARALVDSLGDCS